MSDVIQLAERLNEKFGLVVQANEASLVLAKISNLQQVMKELSSPEFGKEADPELLHKKFLELHRKFNEFTKLTNAGKASPELRKTKLKMLQNWLDKYEGPEQAVISGLPKKYDKKNVVLSPQALKQVKHFKNYIPHIMNWMDKLGPRYQELKDVVSDLLEKGKTLQTHLDKFIITDDFIPELELFAATKPPPVYPLTGKEPEVTPAKMLKTIQTTINGYHKFSVATSNKYKEVEALVNELYPIDLGEFLDRTNKRNKLIQALLHDLVDINKSLYQNKFSAGPLLREKYYRLVEECMPLLPDHVAVKLEAVIKPRKGKGRFQNVLDQSLQGLQKYDPTKDPAMKYQSPHVQNYTPTPASTPVQPTMEQRVDTRLRNQPTPADTQYPGVPLSQPEKDKYQQLWQQEGNALTPEEKARYEALWNQ